MGWLGSVLGWPSNTILVGVRPEVAAALFGVVVGVLTERIARALGRLRCEASGWETKFTSALTKFGEFREIEPGQAEMLARRVEYRFAIDLYNGKEVPAGLRDITVELVREDGESLTSRPYDLLSVGRDPSFDVLTRSTVDVINIPPRQFVRKELAGSFDSREAVVALTSERWKRVQLVGKRPKRPLLWRKTYRNTVTETLTSRPWWRRMFGG